MGRGDLTSLLAAEMREGNLMLTVAEGVVSGRAIQLSLVRRTPSTVGVSGKGSAGGQAPCLRERHVRILAHLLELVLSLPALLLLHMQVGEAHELVNSFIHLLIQCGWAWALQPGEGGGRVNSWPCHAPCAPCQHERQQASWVSVKA